MAWTWPDALYESIAAGIRSDVLAVCVAHQGMHCWYLNGCQALPPQRSRWERYLTSRDPSPEPPPAIRVEIDEERLATAIVAASRATREERRVSATPQEPVVRQQPACVLPTEPNPSHERTIPTVTVWSPGPDDGAGG